MSRKVLSILGHPRSASLCGSLSDAYLAGAAAAGADIRSIRIGDLQFNYGTPVDFDHISLEPDLERVQESLRWADHIALVYPNWWGASPGQLRVLLERVLMPGFAFKYHAKGLGWDRLLMGRTAELLVTMDTPSLYYRVIYGAAGDKIMANRILGFCGVRCVRTTHFSPVRTSDLWHRRKWIEKAAALGASAAT